MESTPATGKLMPTPKKRHIPQEIYDRIVFHVEDCQYEDNRYSSRSNEVYDLAARERLSILRLVNKGFCCSASVRLFRTVQLTSLAKDPEVPTFRQDLWDPNGVWGPTRLLALSESRYRLDVRRIVIKATPDDDFFMNHKCWFLQLFEDIADLLGSCFHRLHRLSSLSITVYLGVLGQWGLYLQECDEYDCGLNEGLREQMKETVTNIFRHLMLVDLSELELILPIAFFSIVSQLLDEASLQPHPSPMSLSMRNLTSLSLNIRDNSGLVGSAGFQLSYPKGTSTSRLLGMVALPSHLKLLSIRCPYILDMAYLDVSSLNSLQSVDLTRAKISFDQLMALSTQNRASLQAIFLKAVGLKDGTWADILIGFCHIPQIRSFVLHSCGYMEDPGFANWYSVIREDPIRTPYDLDRFALGDIQRHVAANRYRLQLLAYSESEYGCVQLMSTEQLWAERPWL